LAEDVYQDVCVKAIGANEVFDALEQVNGLFFQDAQDDATSFVDPVFIAGLPE
jgi:DNA-directed RNA polymerase specialized sigma24 family protein